MDCRLSLSRIVGAGVFVSALWFVGCKKGKCFKIREVYC